MTSYIIKKYLFFRKYIKLYFKLYICAEEIFKIVNIETGLKCNFIGSILSYFFFLWSFLIHTWRIAHRKTPLTVVKIYFKTKLWFEHEALEKIRNHIYVQLSVEIFVNRTKMDIAVIDLELWFHGWLVSYWKIQHFPVWSISFCKNRVPFLYGFLAGSGNTIFLDT